MKYLQTAVVGCILVLALSLVSHIAESLPATLFAVVLLGVVIAIAKKVAHHFHHGHTHEGDSELDSSIGITLIAVNILHPLVDGFALYGTYVSQGSYLFASVLVGIAIHELFRQSALVVVFRQFGYSAWKVVLPALGGMALGVFLGKIGGELPSGLEPYIDAVTFNAYAFIVAEQVFAHEDMCKKSKLIGALFAGIIVSALFITFFRGH